MPVEVPDWYEEYGDKCTAEAGKVGYARKFIQAFARKYELKTIFMLDDNIPYFSDVQVTENGEIRRDGSDHVELKDVPLFNLLRHLEGLYDSTAGAPKENYDLHMDFVCKTRNSYTGPPHDYGVIGIAKFRGYTKGRMKKPFKNTHVYKLCLINMEALDWKEIQYKPWEVWEDLHLNNDCDQNGLYVVKFNRFVAHVRNLQTWQPKVYEWNSETRLEVESTRKLSKAADESDTLLKYIRDWAPPTPPKRWEDYYPSGPKPAELVRLVNKIKKLCPANHHFASVCPSKLGSYLHDMPGLASFEKHVLVLPKTACCNSQWLTLNDFKREVIKPHFEAASADKELLFQVVSSHNVCTYDVSLILVYVEGRSKYMNAHLAYI